MLETSGVDLHASRMINEETPHQKRCLDLAQFLETQVNVEDPGMAMASDPSSGAHLTPPSPRDLEQMTRDRDELYVLARDQRDLPAPEALRRLVLLEERYGFPSSR